MFDPMRLAEIMEAANQIRGQFGSVREFIAELKDVHRLIEVIRQEYGSIENFLKQVSQ